MKIPPEWIINDCIRIANQEAKEDPFFNHTIKDLEEQIQKIKKEITERKNDLEAHKKAIKEAREYLNYLGIDWKNESK